MFEILNPPEALMRKAQDPLTLAVIFSLFIWVAESFIDAHFFLKGTFLLNLFWPEPSELWMRIVIIVLVFLFALSSHTAMKRQKKIEAKLRKDELILEKAQEIAKIGSWDLNLVTGELQWTDEIYRIFGLDPTEFNATYEAFLNSVHPGDRERVKKAVEEAIEHHQDYTIEHRIVQPNGTEREVLEQGKVYFDEGHNKPTRMIGTVQDVTEQKKITERLCLSSLVFDHSLEAVFITDAEGNFQLVNKTFTETTGYTEEEVRGKNVRILKSGRHDDDFFQHMWRTLLKQGKWQGEIWNRRKNGEEYLQWHAITSVKNEKGEITRFLNFFTDITEKNEIETQLLHQSFHDALTGLANRSLFIDRLRKAIRNTEIESKPLTIMFLGLDRFKNVNDSLGHNVGDELLKAVCSRLLETVHQEATLARMGGDEFGLLLPHIDHEDDAYVIATAILDLFRPPFEVAGNEIYITSSIGIGSYPVDGETAETLIKNANTAMSRAKEQGKNNFQLYNPLMNIRATELNAMERNLRKALLKDEIYVYYQPKVNIETGDITGMEALVRWQRPNGEMISPGDFIPLAEETGIITLIGEWVLREACRQTKAWLDMGYKDLVVSVNLSALQFQQQDLVSTVCSSLRETGLPAEHLDLEITESTIMKNTMKAIKILKEFRSRKMKVSIDDFGTGYSSLGYLKQFPIDTLKIDRTFIQDLTKDRDDEAITSVIISLGKCLNLKVVAEGVETREQLDFLKERGCNEIQGYYFSKPVPAADFERYLREGKNLHR